MLDMMKALAGRGQMEPDESEMEDTGEENDDLGNPSVDPRSMSSDGKTIFIDKDMFPDGCKVGDEVMITATVLKHGEKYGISVGEIAKKNANGESNSADL